MGVRVPLKRKVPAGSNPVHTAFHGLVYALVAQGTECWLPKPSVGGSNPSRRTIFQGLLGQLSFPSYTPVAQRTEHNATNVGVGGSNPSRRASLLSVFGGVAQLVRALVS